MLSCRVGRHLTEYLIFTWGHYSCCSNFIQKVTLVSHSLLSTENVQRGRLIGKILNQQPQKFFMLMLKMIMTSNQS